jgi:hypothetical protein
MAYLNQRCRSAADAKSAIGAIVYRAGSEFRCVDHNDLGVLYWQIFDRNGKPKGKMIYDRHLDAMAGFSGAY